MFETFFGVVFAAIAGYMTARWQTRHFLTWWYNTLDGELPAVAEFLERGSRTWGEGEVGHYYHTVLEAPNIESYLVGRSWLIPRTVFAALIQANHMRIAMERFHDFARTAIASAKGQTKGRAFFARVAEAYAEAAKRARRAHTALESIRGDFYLRP